MNEKKEDNIAKRIKMLINEKGYKNQKEFCLAIEKKYNTNFSAPLLTDILKGKRRTIDNIKYIANMLDSSIDYICCNTDSRNKENMIQISDIIGLDDSNVSKLERFNKFIKILCDKNIDISDKRQKYFSKGTLNELKKIMSDEEIGIITESYNLMLVDYYDKSFELKDLLHIKNIFNLLISNKNIFALLYLIYQYICFEDLDDFYIEVFMGDINDDNNYNVANNELKKDILLLELRKRLDEMKLDIQSTDIYYQSLLKRREKIIELSKEKGNEDFAPVFYDLKGLEKRIKNIEQRRKDNEK